MSKFQLAILILIVAIICAISIVYIRILRIKATLDKLYWIAENTHSGMVGLAIDIMESNLNKSLAIMSIALVALAIAVILLLLNKCKVFKEKSAVAMALILLLVSFFQPSTVYAQRTTFETQRKEVFVPAPWNT